MLLLVWCRVAQSVRVLACISLDAATRPEPHVDRANWSKTSDGETESLSVTGSRPRIAVNSISNVSDASVRSCFYCAACVII